MIMLRLFLGDPERFLVLPDDVDVDALLSEMDECVRDRRTMAVNAIRHGKEWNVVINPSAIRSWWVSDYSPQIW